MDMKGGRLHIDVLVSARRQYIVQCPECQLVQELIPKEDMIYAIQKLIAWSLEFHTIKFRCYRGHEFPAKATIRKRYYNEKK